MKFEYTPKELTIEAYGEIYTLPKKTPEVMGQILTAQNAMAGGTAFEQTKAILDGIAVFIGKNEVARIYPDINKADTDEVSAFWFTLNNLYNQASKEIIDTYSPNRADRVK